MTTRCRRLPFHLVDVFAVEPLTGNPLAVVTCTEELELDIYRRIAREFNQSETTFILPPTQPSAHWRLRSFTAAGAEVGGAGHNALGAWWWLAESGRLELGANDAVFRQEIGGRVLPLTVVRRGCLTESVSMEQETPEQRRRVDELAPLAKALGLAANDLGLGPLPCQVVYTGAAHLLVPVRDRCAVDRIQPDAKALLPVLQAAGAEGCYVFSLDPLHDDAAAYARFFNPTVGIVEDPATGTAAGPLAAHLVAHGLAAGGCPIVIEQGTAMGRTSLITATVLPDTVTISGRGVIVASGELITP